MAQPVMQKSFNSGEWAPALYSRVDIEKYHSGAKLLRNWFVDYRGGASTRPGTRYTIQAFKSTPAVRIIPFQASFAISYVLEFGDGYIRFINNGAPVLQSGLAITGASRANPCVIQVTNSYSVGDWVFISGVAGMTQLNGNYYEVLAASPSQITLGWILDGSPINSTSFGAYTSGGTVARVYVLPSPYAAADLALLKFSQSVNSMIICHPNYPVQVLTLITSNNWTIVAANFGTSAITPTNTSITTTLNTGSTSYAYEITAVDAFGNESSPTAPIRLNKRLDLRTTAGSILIGWHTTAGSTSYNVYKSDVSYFGAIPVGMPYGFIGNVTGNTIIDSNIAPDFTQTPPIGQNPFLGRNVASLNLTGAGVYTTVPSVNFIGGTPNSAAIASASLSVATQAKNVGGSGFANGDTVNLGNGVVVTVLTNSGGAILTTALTNPGEIDFGDTPANPVAQVATSGGGTGATFDLTWGVGQLTLVNSGIGYHTAPTVAFDPVGATATATLSTLTNINPSVPGFFQQRLVLAASNSGPETMDFSQPGSFFNYNVSNPIQDNDAIEVSLASGQLETIKSFVSTSAGLIVFTDKANWLVNGGSPGSAISPAQIVANRQSYDGANDVPPILSNYDILYVESKGSVVRDSTYNFYANVFTGSDISILSSHLFYGYQILEWAWAQEPFKLVWAIRNDGILLSLTFAKEQDFIAWAHHDTEGLFLSVATVVEQVAQGDIDAVYFVVERTINGNTVKYIERLAERIFPNGAEDAWCVDAGLQYNGSPTTTFSGAQHLAGETVTGLADGNVIPPFIMPVSGSFTLPVAASKVTVGLPFLPQLETLSIDTGEPTIQAKMKKLPAATARVVDSLGLQCGSDFNNLVAMKDLVIGNVGSMTNEVVTGLVTGDVRTLLDPVYNTKGRHVFQQPNPLPATITGVIPQLAVGDTER